MKSSTFFRLGSPSFNSAPIKGLRSFFILYSFREFTETIIYRFSLIKSINPFSFSMRLQNQAFI